MPMIIGMYVLIPFVANAIKDYDLDMIIKPLIFFAILSFVVPFIISLLKIYDIKHLKLGISLGFSGGIYGIYMICGYLIKKGYFKKFKSKVLSLMFISTFLVFICINLFYFNQGFDYIHIYYESPFILVCSICLFELITRIEKVKFYNIIQPMALYSFGVYVVHMFFRELLKPHIKMLSIANPFKFIILTAITLVLSYIAVIIISKIPKVGKYVLFIKS